MQLARNLSKNDEQYFLGITSWRCTGKLYGQLCNTSKDKRRTGRTNGQVPEDSGETQLVFQMIKIWLQHGRNIHTRGNSWKVTDQNETREDQSSEGMEDTDKTQKYRELSWICKLLSMLYSKLQLYSKTTKQAKR